jgi:hypothetical protein
VRLSSGEAGLDLSFAIPFLWAGLHFYVAAPEDGRTPALSLIPLASQYAPPLGLKTSWPSGGTYQQFNGLPLLPAVAATLKQYERWHV